MLINGYEFVATFLAVARAGAIAAPLNPAYTTDEFTFFMEDAGSRVAILPNGPHPAREAAANLGIKTIETDLGASNGDLRVTLSSRGVELTSTADAPAPASDDVALFLHTSGTTSRPKGVPLRHLNLIRSIGNIKNTYELTPDDTSLIVMPLFHVHGLDRCMPVNAQLRRYGRSPAKIFGQRILAAAGRNFVDLVLCRTDHPSDPADACRRR